MKREVLAVLMLFFSIVSVLPSLATADDSRWNPLKDRLVADGFDREYVDTVFSAVSLEFDSKVMARKMGALLKRRQSPPAKVRKRDEGFDERYVGPVLLAGAYAFLRENYPLLQDIDKEYGVRPTVLVALLLVETRLGFTLGDDPAFSNLANMAAAQHPALFMDDLNPIKDLSSSDQKWLHRRTGEKADWAYKELVALLGFSRENSINPVSIPGSPYGAFGICQFMPSTAVHYAVDGDEDGRIDLFKKPDALASMASFLERHGWKNSLPHKKQMKVIYYYNHSTYYARTILEVSKQLESIKATFGPE